MRLLFELLLFFVLLFFFGGLSLIFYRWLSKRFFKQEEPLKLKEEKAETLQTEQKEG